MKLTYVIREKSVVAQNVTLRETPSRVGEGAETRLLFPEIVKNRDRRATFVLGFHIPAIDNLTDFLIDGFA
ncbi:hypothetical protein QCE80_15015, partial [Staphylococcus aureus]|nr:hypothetical protein [Staphylococcus aureus]